MPTTLTTEIMELSSAIIKVECKNENEVSVSPITIKWSLINNSGEIINSRENVDLTPAAAMYIILSGVDLELESQDSAWEKRHVIVEGTYLSIYGVLPINDSCSFFVTNLNKIPE